MNQVFKVVRCLSTGVFKAVPEFAKSGKKSKSISLAAGAIAASVALSTSAIAAVGDPIASGDASDGSLAMGVTNTVTGSNSTAIGHSNTVNGDTSNTLGMANDVVGSGHTVLGNANSAGEFWVWEEYYNYETGRWEERQVLETHRSNAILGNENSARGSHSIAVGSANQIQNDRTILIGGSNTVDTVGSGAYGQGNSVGTWDSASQERFRLVRPDDGYERGEMLAFRYGLQEGGSYAYGNENRSIGNQNHTVGNSNMMEADISGTLGNDNYIRNEFYEMPAFRSLGMNDRLTSNGSFLVGNSNYVDGNNTHAMGNENDINVDRNVTVGNANRVNGYGDGMDEVRLANLSETRQIYYPGSRNPSTAIVGERNYIKAPGVHIVGSENTVGQEGSYVVGANNRVESNRLIGPPDLIEVNNLVESDRVIRSPDVLTLTADQPMSVNRNAPPIDRFNPPRSSLFGSDNDVMSEGVSMLGSSNIVEYNSTDAVTAGSYNFIKGVSVANVGNQNYIEKDVGGAHGSRNRVRGNANVIEAIDHAMWNEVFEGVDIDGDGIVDYPTIEAAQAAAFENGSYTYGNVNDIDGEANHIVGNQNNFSGNKNTGVGNNNMIGEIGGLNGDAVTPSINFNESATYGNDNALHINSSQVVGNKNIVVGELSIDDGMYFDQNASDSSVLGNNNLLAGSDTHISGTANKVAGSKNTITGSNNTIGVIDESAGTLVFKEKINVLGSNNKVAASNTNVQGAENIVGDGAFHVVMGSRNEINNADASTAIGVGNKMSGATESAAIGHSNTIGQFGVFALGNNITSTQENSVILGSSSTDKEATAVASTTIGDMTFDNYAGVSSIENGVVSVGSAGAERQIINVGAGDVSATSTDAVNGSQLYSVASGIDRVAGSVVSNFGGNAALSNDGTITHTNIGGTGQDTLDGAIAAANNSIKSVTGDENITATTDAEKNVTVALNKEVTLDSVTTGNTVINTNGLINGTTIVNSNGFTAGAVTMTSSGLDNAGNRVTSVGDATELNDAVNLKQLNASLRDTTGDENITATKTDTGYNVALNKKVTLDSVTAGNTVFNNDGVRAGSVFLSSSTGLNNAGYRVSGVGDAVNRDDAVNFGQLGDVDDRLTRENIAQTNNISGNRTNISLNTQAINKGFNVGNSVTSNKFELGDTVDITSDSNTRVTTTPTGVQVGLADNISVGTVQTGGTSMSNAGLTTGDVTVSSAAGLNNAGFTVSGVGNAVNNDDAVNLGQFKEALGNIEVEGIATTVTGDQNIVATTNGTNVSLGLAKDVNVDSLTAGDVKLSATSGLNNAGFTVSGVGNAVSRDDAVNLGQLDEVDERLTAKNEAQDIVINSKADTTYVDAKNDAQDVIINSKLDIEVFEASQQAQDQNLKAETDRLDAADKDLQVQVNNKVENSVFEADQARQDATIEKVADESKAADKDLQAQVNNKVENSVFEADQARQDAALKDKADKEYVDSSISTESSRYNNQLKEMSAENGNRLNEIVDKQSMVDIAQDARITDNSSRITDLGYKVGEIEDSLSAAIASTVAFASMPGALNPGETRISGGSGYYNGAGAIAIGLSGSNADGAYNYKIGSSYTKEGGVVVGAGVSMRVW